MKLILKWLRCRLESALFLLWLTVLVPVLLSRGLMHGLDQERLRGLLSRWKEFLLHGLDGFRQAYWPAMCFERKIDIGFYVASLEWFGMWNVAREAPLEKNASERILIVKLAHFGDALHIFPMMRELRRQCPNACIDLLVGPWCEGLAQTYGLHNRLLVQTPRLGLFTRGVKMGRRRSFWREWRWLWNLRRNRYDMVLSTSTTTLAELLLMQAVNARRWVGSQVPGGLYAPSGGTPIPYDSQMYEATRVMRLLESCGLHSGPDELFYPLLPGSTNAALALLDRKGLAGGMPFAVLCPGAGWPGKQWLIERFAQLGDALGRRFGLRVVLAGTKGEKTLCDDIAALMDVPPIVVAGETSIEQLAAVLAKADLFVGNDSGPMHLAACFRTPSVVLFGPTKASKWSPRHKSSRCIQHEDCSGCIPWHYRASCLHGNRCMKAITVDEVLQAVDEVLREG